MLGNDSLYLDKLTESLNEIVGKDRDSSNRKYFETLYKNPDNYSRSLEKIKTVDSTKCFVLHINENFRYDFSNYLLAIKLLKDEIEKVEKARYGMLPIINYKNAYFNNVYYSNPRSMARFGLLLQQGGSWNGTNLINDAPYVNSMTNTSQNINPSYGYLTWLNGKLSHMLPAVQFSFTGSMVPNAPGDMYAAPGKNDQKIYVVPSKKFVIIRMSDSAGNVQLAVSSFDNELWGYLKQVF